MCLHFFQLQFFRLFIIWYPFMKYICCLCIFWQLMSPISSSMPCGSSEVITHPPLNGMSFWCLKRLKKNVSNLKPCPYFIKMELYMQEAFIEYALQGLTRRIFFFFFKTVWWISVVVPVYTCPANTNMRFYL